MILATKSLYSAVTRFFERIRRNKENYDFESREVITAEREYIKTKREEDKQEANNLASKVGGFIIRI